MIEVCQNTLGADFFGQPGGAFVDKHAIDSKAQQMLQEMMDEGKTLLKASTAANCNLLAGALAAAGGTATVAAGNFKFNFNQFHLNSHLAPSAAAEDKGSANRNKKKMHRKANPTIWTSGKVAQSLASEYIYVLRQLLDPNKSSSNWTACVTMILNKSLLELPSLLSGPNAQDRIRRSLAALCVLGGYTETIRIGGRVQVNEPGMQLQLFRCNNIFSGLSKEATIVDLVTGGSIAEIIFDNDPAKTAHKLPVSKLTAISELELSQTGFPLTVETLSALLVLLKSHPSKDSIPSWLFTDMKGRALKALNQLLIHPSSAQVFIQTPGKMFFCLNASDTLNRKHFNATSIGKRFESKFQIAHSGKGSSGIIRKTLGHHHQTTC